MCAAGIYLTVVMAITSISIVMTVIVLNFHYRGPNRKEVPLWLKRFILEKIAVCTCSTTTVASYPAPPPPPPTTFLTTATEEEGPCNDLQDPKRCLLVNHGRHQKLLQDDIFRTLRYLLARQEIEDHHLRLTNEWRQVATVIDRFLFWVFLVVTAVSSLSFLVLVPLQRRALYYVNSGPPPLLRVRSEDPSVYAVKGRGLAFLINNLYYEDITVNIPNTLDLETQGIKVYLIQNKAINIYNIKIKVEKRPERLFMTVKMSPALIIFSMKKINMKELDYALQNTDQNKTPGPDGIHGRMISNLGKIGKERLLLFSISTGKLENCLKTVKMQQ
ncbi:hypothetical protein LAZ67_15000962 [Cordylochernes scorpioides]|uniref:Neurotransmitter-gated ion-channel transmembrane domain-containing protein n=1 Tax=Cordylochernes scorpioides TaxID=51811 RepID=A0ABY6LCJ4_9ARAC|nr:hypothetical protein LAZ67_15000962 [Cordylochernes scorpioides]